MILSFVLAYLILGFVVTHLYYIFLKEDIKEIQKYRPKWVIVLTFVILLLIWPYNYYLLIKYSKDESND